MSNAPLPGLEPDDEARLKKALRQLPAPGGLAQVEALEARVLAQWRDAHPAPPAGPAGGVQTLVRGGRGRWLGASSLLAGALIVATLWWLRPDPVLEELLQPDVLSQLAAGEL